MVGWWWLDALAGLLTGVLSAFGLGGGTLLMIYMTSLGGLEQHAAQSINLLYFLPCAGAALVSHIKNRQVELGVARPAILAGLVTGAAGAAAALFIDGSLLRRAFGLGLIVIGLREAFARKRE